MRYTRSELERLSPADLDAHVEDLRREADLLYVESEEGRKVPPGSAERMREIVNEIKLATEVREKMPAHGIPHPSTSGKGAARLVDPETRILAPGDAVADWAGQQGHQDQRLDGVRLGAVLRGMATGKMSPNVRAALELGTDSAGGYTVPTLLSSQFIDRLRARTRVIQAGAQTVPLLGETSFAKITGDVTAEWHAENAAVTDSQPTFDRALFTPKTLIALVKGSRELFEDSINVEQALEASFAGALAVELDRAAMFGAGSATEPRGVVNVAGIGQVDMGTDGAALTDYDPLLDARQALLAGNADEPTAAIMAPRTSTALAKLKTGLAGDKTQLPRPAELAEVPFLHTTSVPIDETHGLANNASRILLGDWAQLWIGVRTDLRIEMHRSSGVSNFQTWFLAYLRADIAVVQPAAFAEIVGIIP